MPILNIELVQQNRFNKALKGSCYTVSEQFEIREL